MSNQCEKYIVRGVYTDELPECLDHEGLMLPCVPDNFEVLGIIERSAEEIALGRTIFSKLAIVEACIDLGIWSDIRTGIKADENVSDCWDACVEVNTEYGRTADFLKANLTEAQINAIKFKVAGL